MMCSLGLCTHFHPVVKPGRSLVALGWTIKCDDIGLGRVSLSSQRGPCLLDLRVNWITLFSCKSSEDAGGAF